MTIKDFFSKINEQGNIDIDFLDTLPEGEIPDEFLQRFESSFLTVDRAATEREVVKKIRANILDPIDRDLLAIVETLSPDQVREVQNQKSTYDRLSAIKKMIPEALEKVSKLPDNEDMKKKLKSMQATIDEYQQKNTALETQHKDTLTKVQKEFDTRLNNYQLDSELEKLSRNYIFADAYEKNRGDIQNALLSGLKSKHLLQFVAKENGEKSIQVSEPGEDGTPRQKFNGNTPVTINSLLDEVYKPYVKVSNGSEPPKDTRTTVPPQNQPQAHRQGIRTTVQ